MVAAIDIHKQVFQAAVLDSAGGEFDERRFAATPAALNDWAMQWQDRVEVVAIEATTGWRWVWRELSARGFDVRLVDSVEARALRGKRKRAKTDRLDARWLCLLLAKELLPEAWLPPAEIQRLRDQTRHRKALVDDRTRWAQRLHALLTQEGWPCARGRLLTAGGRRWAAALRLSPAAAAQVESYLRLLEMLDAEIAPLERELRRFARGDRRCQALQTIYGIGPILACHVLAELGRASRFRDARQVVRHMGLDPVVDESGESRRRGRLSKVGSPHLRWALVEAAKNAHRQSSPDRSLYLATSARAGGQRATLTIARKLGKRAYHRLRALEAEAA